MTRPACPGCAAPVDKLAPSPSPHAGAERCSRCRAGQACRPHVVSAYPCGCWMPLAEAARISREEAA